MSCMLGKRGARKQPILMQKKQRRAAWKHRFACLAYYGQERIPATDSELYEAGLRENEVQFERLDLHASEFVEVVQNVFPKLIAGGGFQFCKCLPNSSVLEPLSKLAPLFTRNVVSKGWQCSHIHSASANGPGPQ